MWWQVAHSARSVAGRGQLDCPRPHG